MKRALVLAIAAAAIAGLAGCGAVRHPVLRTRQSFLPLGKSVSCPATIDRTVTRAELKRLHAVVAVRCIEGQRVYPGHGEWLVWRRYVLTRGVAVLKAWYELPNQPYTGGFCLDNLVIVPVTAFVDPDGRALVPRWPVDGCHHPRAGQPKDLSWRLVSIHRVRQLVSAPALAAGCAMQIKNLNEGAAGPLGPLPAGPMFPSTPSSVRVCIFRTPANDLEVGNFVRGFTLDRAKTSRLLGVLSGAGPTSSCPAQRLFAAISSRVGWGEVEIGGCWRVAHWQGPFGFGRTTNPAVVRAVLGG